MIAELALLAALAVPALPVGVHPAYCAKMPRGKPFALVLSTKTPKVKKGTAPQIAVRLTNCSRKVLDTAVTWWEGIPLDTGYVLTITDQRGKRLLPNVHHVTLGANALRFVHLEPGKSYTEQADLSMHYRLEKPGKYRIEVIRKSPEKFGGAVLKSNVLTITVTK
jgi:hypothetical protein